MRFFKRRYVVAREHPAGLVGDTFTVKARSPRDAVRAAVYDQFKRDIDEWYSWSYTVHELDERSVA